MRISTVLAAFLLIAGPDVATAADEYTISGAFNGCTHGKLYPLVGGGILECQEYQYFYEYRPRVIASGWEVIVIGNNKVSARLYKGAIYETYVSGEFNGCDFGKVYKFDNTLIFQCNTFKYTYAYHPEVRIFVVEGRQPTVTINGEPYEGQLFKSQ